MEHAGRCSAAVDSSLFAEVIHLDSVGHSQSAEVAVAEAVAEAVAAEEVEEQVELEEEQAMQSVWQDDRCHSL